MIYTVTFNPAIDYMLTLPCLLQGEINRSATQEVFAGGKGINVSKVLKELGVESVALGFVAGFTGSEIERLVNNDGIATDFVYLKNGMSRINVKIRSQHETDINCDGPQIEGSALNEFFDKIEMIQNGDMIVLAGSVPKAMPKDVYEKILSALQQKCVGAVVDAEGELLLNTLKYRPFLIKPNHIELAAIMGRHLGAEEEIVAAAKELQSNGARNVMVSMGEKGAILIAETGEVLKVKAPQGVAVNTVGAGDSTVAGFLVGYLENCDYETAVKLAVAAGSATAFSTGLATKEKITEVLRLL